MTTEIHFCLLGPLLVRRGGVAVLLPRGKQRTVLAALLLNPGQVVSLDEVAEILWESSPPFSARVTTQNYVMRLRKALGSDGSRIITQPRGYLIQVEPSELDVTRFQAHLVAADAAASGSAWQKAAAQAQAALDLWRGEPLIDVESELLTARDAPRLADLRLRALEVRVDADLHLGRHTEVIGELRQLAGANPLRERLHGLLMLALCRDGRQAEALTAYQHARHVLAEELGVEPGPRLRDLYQRMLSTDPALAVSGPGGPGGSPDAGPPHAVPPRAVPRELPPSVPGFTGRAAELRTLARLLDQPGGQPPRAVPIAVIDGTAGVGKTALAVHWAHQVARRFTDGQLYVNLRGYDPEQPLSATEALAGFLRSLGVPGTDIPPSADQRAARYRSELAGKRMLIVLDNAGSADQVRPLLPGTAACAVVITSRDALAGLVARDGAARLDLDVLPLQEATTLLQTLVGPRAAAEPAATAELADRCNRLPLALRIAAELAARRADASLAALTDELARLDTRLDVLNVGADPHTQMRAVFSWSYRHLDPAAAHDFRLIGLHPGPDLEPYAAAALTGVPVTQASRVLDALASANLISPTGPGRHGMYDLLRGYARELTGTVQAGQEQRSALTRLFDHYLQTAATAMDVLFPAERRHRPPVPRPASPAPPLADPAAARHWLDRERAALVSAARHAAAHGWPGHATRLAATVASYLRDGGYFPEAVIIFGCAIDAARHTGDRAGEATALNETGLVDWRLGRYQQGADHHRQALALFRASGDQTGEAHALGNLGLDEVALASYEEAARHQQEAVALYRETGDPFGEARALGQLGVVRRRQGRYEEAAAYHRQSLDMCRDIGDRHGEAYALARLGVVDVNLGRPQNGAGYLERGVALLHDVGDQGESEILIYLGHAYRELGRYEQAAGAFEQALARFREIGNLAQQAEACNGLGDAALQAGHAGKAREHHAAALQLSSEAGSTPGQARAHSGLARDCQADGNTPQARQHWREALTRYTAIGAAEANEIRRLLAAAENGGDGDKRPAGRDRGTTDR